MALQHTQGFWPVVAAIGGNATVTIIKFVASATSGSSSMFSEAIHSLADTVNQVLLLIGLGRSGKRADDSCEYGYGNERFFWALISACGVLFVGAGVTVYSGFSTLTGEHHIEFSPIIFIVLFVSLIIEAYTFWVAARALRRTYPDLPWTERLRAADPSTLSVYLEDAVAVIGVCIAAASITLSYYTGNPVWDAAGSVIIGVLLGAVAITLILKNRTYLIGHAMPEDMREAIIRLLQSDAAVEKVIDFKSATVGFGKYRIKCEVEFNGSALMRGMLKRNPLRDQFDEVNDDFEEFKKFTIDFADRIPRVIGTKIDELEARIKKQFPSVRHIDLEVN